MDENLTTETRRHGEKSWESQKQDPSTQRKGGTEEIKRREPKKIGRAKIKSKGKTEIYHGDAETRRSQGEMLGEQSSSKTKTQNTEESRRGKEERRNAEENLKAAAKSERQDLSEEKRNKGRESFCCDLWPVACGLQPVT